jgi:hypothetical protein
MRILLVAITGISLLTGCQSTNTSRSENGTVITFDEWKQIAIADSDIDLSRLPQGIVNSVSRRTRDNGILNLKITFDNNNGVIFEERTHNAYWINAYERSSDDNVFAEYLGSKGYSNITNIGRFSTPSGHGQGRYANVVKNSTGKSSFVVLSSYQLTNASRGIGITKRDDVIVTMEYSSNSVKKEDLIEWFRTAKFR